MYRNEKTGRFESAKDHECFCEPDLKPEEAVETDESQDFGYYSKLLKKDFDKLSELRRAEEEYKEQHNKELLAKEEKKKLAEEVKSAISFRIKVESDAQKAKAEAYKNYLAAIDAANNQIKNAKDKEAELLKSFCTKYKEGFHDTIKIDDITYSCDYEMSSSSNLDTFNKLFSFFNF